MQRPLGVVFESSGRSEDSHHCVTGELLDGSPRALDFLGHRVVEASQKRTRSLGILRAPELCRAHEIGEEHGRELSLLDVHPRILVFQATASLAMPFAGRASFARASG